MHADGIPFGHFLLKKRLARGGMAEVFLARQRGPEGFDRRVAVKRVLPHLVESSEFVRMFHDEARLAARLTHPNVVHIYEFGKVGEHYFIAMEYVDGVHAGHLIKHGARERLPLALVGRIGADACAALRYAHQLEDADGRQLRVVHRDISPPNLMISYDGVVKLVDFGIAKAVSQVEQTRPGVVKGKYAYMSPEQTTNQPLDGRSDVFSLALVLWELVAGRVALDRTDPVEAMRAIRDGRIPPIETIRPDTPAALAAALGQALRVKRDERPTAAELGNVLEGYIKSTPDMATSLQLAEWVGTRFPRTTQLTGEQPALGGTPRGTRPATMAATAATAAATAHQAAATASQTAEEMAEDTVMSAPPTAILPPGARPLPPPGMPDITGQFHRTSRLRIAIVATLAAAAGVAAMLLFFWGGNSDADTVIEPVAHPAAVSLGTAPPAADAAAPLRAAVDAAPAEVRPMLAELEVLTEPANASIALGPDRPTGTSPARFADLQPGTLHVVVELDGYEPVERELVLAPGERRTLELPLRKLTPPAPPTAARPPPRPTSGALTVRTNPYSEVWLGGRRLGVTPFANIKLPAGTHTLTFKHPGKKPHRRTVTIRPGQTAKLNFKLP